MDKLENIIKRFSGLSVAVVGDLMLDRCLLGDIERVSPESAAPVVILREEKLLLGGAANTAFNIASLGGKVSIFGRVGKDASGQTVRRLLEKAKIKTDGVVSAPQITTEKSRVIARGNQVVRIDREDAQYCDTKTEEMLCRRLSVMGACDCLVVSDYAKGVITPRVAETILNVGKKKGIPVVVDTKPRHAEFFRGATIFTPNKKEAEDMAGVAISDQKSLEKIGQILQSKLQAHVLITQGADGMSLFQERTVRYFPSVAREVFDVTGAGDTVAAVYALGLAAKLSFEDSAHLATLAAGIVVGKQGTAATRPDELLRVILESRVV